jgi:hypothetical protein
MVSQVKNEGFLRSGSSGDGFILLGQQTAWIRVEEVVTCFLEDRHQYLQGVASGTQSLGKKSRHFDEAIHVHIL